MIHHDCELPKWSIVHKTTLTSGDSKNLHNNPGSTTEGNGTPQQTTREAQPCRIQCRTSPSWSYTNKKITRKHPRLTPRTDRTYMPCPKRSKDKYTRSNSFVKARVQISRDSRHTLSQEASGSSKLAWPFCCCCDRAFTDLVFFMFESERFLLRSRCSSAWISRARKISRAWPDLERSIDYWPLGADVNGERFE